MKANSIDLRKRIQIFGIMEKNLPINYIKGLEGLGLVKVLFKKWVKKYQINGDIILWTQGVSPPYKLNSEELVIWV